MAASGFTVDPLGGGDELPARTSVAVIGGGIAGAMTALCLAEDGIAVLVCEKGRVAGEQSGRSWGWCRKMDRDIRELPLAIAALRLWEDMNRRIAGECGFRRSGIVYLNADVAEETARSAWLKAARPFGLDTRLITADEVDRLLPGSSRRWASALYTPSDGVAEPRLAVPAVLRAVRRLGGRVVEHCPSIGLETAAGRVSAVLTTRGRVACDAVVLAGGAWSGWFLRGLGLRLPQLKVIASVLRTEPAPPLPGRSGIAVWGAGFGFHRRLDGGYTIGYGNNLHEIVPDSFRYLADFLPTLPVAGGDLHFSIGYRFLEEARWAGRSAGSLLAAAGENAPEPNRRFLRRARDALDRSYPAFAELREAAAWGGLIDVLPDVLPVISRVDGLPGLTLATGFSGHGFGIGPAVGRLAADLATGKAPLVDPAPFRFSRFTDGSRPRPQTAV
jgi:glycine/D-amino acid oxidase-like deaminating enzyme